MSREQVFSALREQLPALRETYGVVRLGIFGSFTRDAETADSDVDIVVELDRPLGLRFVELAEHIERIVGRPADILTPEGIASMRNPRVARTIQESVTYV